MNKDTIIDLLKRFPIAFISGLIAFGCVLFIFVRGDLSTELETEEASLISRIKKLDNNVKNAVNLDEDVERVEALVEAIKIRLFDLEQRAVNTNFFYSLEQIVPIRLKSVNQAANKVPSLEVEGDLSLYAAMGYDLVVEGSYADIILLIDELSHVDAFIRVLEVQMALSSQIQASDQVARIRIVVLAEKNS